VVQGHEATLKLFVTHQQLAESVEPAMTDLDDPPASLLPGLAPLGIGFLPSIDDMRDVAMRSDDLHRLGASVACICTQVLAAPGWRSPTLDHDRTEHLVDPLAIIDVGPGHDDRQRDATPVHQQVTLASLFFPDPSGWAQRLLAPSVP